MPYCIAFFSFFFGGGNVDGISLSIEEPGSRRSTSADSALELTFDDMGEKTNFADSISKGSQTVSFTGATTSKTDKFGKLIIIVAIGLR